MIHFNVIVLSWDNSDLTKECIERITHYAELPISLTIIDNGSSLESKRTLLEGLSPTATIIFNYSNRGFAGGVNQGIKLSTTPYVFLLNNDVMCEAPWGAAITHGFKDDPRLGILGEMEVFKKDRIEKHLGLNGLKWNGEIDTEFALVSGHVMIVSREVINKIGLFDEQFYPGLMEDVDYSLRCVQSGYVLKQIHPGFRHISNRTLFTKFTPEQIDAIVADTSRKFFLKHFRDKVTKPVGIAPEISIVGTTYNQGKLMAHGLSVWLEQNTSVDYEVIVIDDGSSDDTDKRMRDLMAKYKNLRYVKATRKSASDQIICPAATNNLGVKLARSKIVAITWFDRIPMKNAVDELYYPHAQKDNVLVTLLTRHIGTDSSLDVIPDSKLDEMLSSVDWFNNPELLVSIAGNVGWHVDPKTQIESACFSFRKSSFEAIGGYDERYVMLPSWCNIDLYTRLKDYCVREIVGNSSTFHQPHNSQRDCRKAARFEHDKICTSGIVRNPNGWGSCPYTEVVL